jgi:hypothetical protein
LGAGARDVCFQQREHSVSGRPLLGLHRLHNRHLVRVQSLVRIKRWGELFLLWRRRFFTFRRRRLLFLRFFLENGGGAGDVRQESSGDGMQRDKMQAKLRSKGIRDESTAGLWTSCDDDIHGGCLMGAQQQLAVIEHISVLGGVHRGNGGQMHRHT